LAVHRDHDRALLGEGDRSLARAVVPALDSDVHDLDGLLRLGTYLWRSG
jgi:hypothetical protein